MSKKLGITEAYEKLDAARRDFELARDSAAFAKSQETDALNAMNKVQKEFDEVVDAIRKNGALRGTDWEQKCRKNPHALEP